MCIRKLKDFTGCPETPQNTPPAVILRQILNHAAACGHIATKPARTIRRNRAAKLTRFLSREEIQRLHRVLDRHAERSESARQQVDIIRLLLLTGCRKNEIVRLRRQEVDGDRLNLGDSKTGPRRVYLNAQARDIIERRMERADGPWVFPSASNPTHPRGDGLVLWYTVRRETGIADVRLHDLRHNSGIRLIPGRPVHGYRELVSLQRVA